MSEIRQNSNSSAAEIQFVSGEAGKEQPKAVVTPQSRSGWTFLTNHSHVLLLIARNPESRMRDLADRVGITERAVQRIIEELAEGGYVTITKQGRRNMYNVRGDHHLRHPVEAARTVGDLIRMVNGETDASSGDHQNAEKP